MAERTVTVCEECRQASCWQGVFLCADSTGANVIELPLSVLREEKREHPQYWEEDACG